MTSKSLAVDAVGIAIKVVLLAIALTSTPLSLAISEPLSSQHPNRLPSPDRNTVIRMLQDRDFASLENMLTSYTKEFDENPVDSTSCRKVFDYVAQIDSQMASRFDDWVTLYPQSYSAHLARGAFLFEQGLLSRGTQFVDKTKQEQLQDMTRFFARSITDLNFAQKLSAKPYLVYRYAMVIAMHSGDKEKTRAIFDAAARLAPTDFNLRSRYLNSLTPRWGGSYGAMENFVEESKKVGIGVSEISRLAAQIPADQGDVSFSDGNFRDAVRDLSKAIEADSRPAWLCIRGRVYWRLNDLTSAQSDFEQGLKLDPLDKSCNEAFGNYLRATGNHQRAIQPLSQLIELAPTPTLYMNRGHSYEALDMYPQAYADYLVAAKHGDVFAQTRVAMISWYAKGVSRDPGQAVYWATQAIRSGQPDAKRFVDKLRQMATMGERSAALFLTEIGSRKGP